MADNVETMAWVREKPWHGLGNEVSDSLTVPEMLVAAEINWSVDKRPMFINTSTGPKAIKDKFALTRDSDDMILDVVGKTYEPVQNSNAFEFFTKFVDAGHMKMETAGSLCNGQYVWGLAKVGQSLNLGKSDKVESYLLMMNPHKYGKTYLLQHTAIRVVCWNTLNAALGSGLKGNQSAFRFAHVAELTDSVRKQAEQALGLAKEDWQDFGETVKVLSEVKASQDDVEEYFFEVLNIDPAELEENKLPRMFEKMQLALNYAPGHDLSEGTWWSALNSVTYVVDHFSGHNRNTALRSAWLGSGAQMKRDAYTLAMQKAGISNPQTQVAA